MKRLISPTLTAKPSSRGLAHHASRLDLIDDTTLTSLPLPPPPNTRKRASTANSTQPNISATADVMGRSLGLQVPETAAEDESYIDEEESEDPIVLVEDYLNPADATQSFSDTSSSRTWSHESNSHRSSLQKRQSLATFKLRLLQQQQKREDASSISNDSFCTSIADTASNNNIVTAKTGHSFPTLEHLEELFGKISGADNLKYCNLCSKPLYEISTIINRRLRQKHDTSVDTRYEEFVCEGCTGDYEQFSNELEGLQNQQYIDSLQLSIKRQRISGIFRDIEARYTTSEHHPVGWSFLLEPRAHSDGTNDHQRKFSQNLIDRFHYLSAMDSQGTARQDWVRNLQQKLRWRWRLCGLIPEAISRQHSIK